MEQFILTFITNGITAIGAFVIGQRRAKKEIEGLALKNIQDSINIYQIIITDLKDNITELQSQVKELQDKVDSLMVENADLKLMLTEEKKKNVSSR